MMSSTPTTDFSSLVQFLDEPFSHAALNISFDGIVEQSTRVLDRAQTELVVSGLDSIRQAQAALESGTRQIIDLQSFLKEQEAKLERLETHFKTLIAPIRQLPPEILQEIFMFVRENENYNIGRCRPSIVAQVNKYWRRVALETPRLWTTIGLRLQVDVDTTAEQLDKLAIWVARARGCPISLKIRLDSKVLDDIDPPLREDLRLKAHIALVDIIETHAGRLEALILRGEAYRGVTSRTPWISNPNFSLPHLKVLDFATWGSLSGTTFPELLGLTHKIYRAAPAIERFMLDGPYPIRTPVAFSWANLKALRCSSSDCPSNIFSRPASSLEFLQINIFDAWPVPSSPYPPLSHLTTLDISVGGRGSRIPIEFFPPLPALRHLCLDLDKDAAFTLKLLRTYGRNLRYLWLSDQLSSESIRACLKLTPNLKALRIEKVDIPLLPDRRRVSLPQLTHLDVTVDCSLNESPEGTLEEIYSGIASGHLYPISTVTLFVHSTWPMTFEERTKQERRCNYGSSLARMGISVHYVWGESVASIGSAYFREKGLFTDWHPVDSEDFPM